MEKKALLLVRVSTLNQDIAQQTEVVKNEAIRDGYTDLVIIEDHESAVKLSEEERNGLNRMKDAILKDSSIDCVYVYEISRIGRQAKIVFSIRDWLIQHNVQLIVLRPYFRMLNDDGTLSETSNIFFGIFASMSENEGYIRKARMRRGVEKAKAMGKHAGGLIPFGYKTDKSHNFIIDEEQAKWVRWIFNSYVNGMSMRRIAREMLEQGIFTSSYLTCVQNINNIIHSERYAGRVNGKPQIIPNDLYDKAQEVCHRNILHTECKETKRICKSILYDRDNGFLLSVNSGSKNYYSKRAKGVSVAFNVIEPIIWDYTLKKYKQLFEQNTSKRLKALVDNIIVLNTKIDNANTKIDEIKKKLDKLEERIILGKVNEDLADRISGQLYKELKVLEDNKAIWANEEHDRQEQYRALTNRAKMTEMSDGTSYYEIELDKSALDKEMGIDEQIDLVKQVVDKVILYRSSRCMLNIEIHNKIDNKVAKIEYDSFRRQQISYTEKNSETSI